MRMTRRMVKRWLAGVLAVSMLSTVSSTTVLAVEENIADTEPRTVAEWSWTDQKSLVWDEDSGTWTLSLTCSEEDALDEEKLAGMLPDSITVTAFEEKTAAEEGDEGSSAVEETDNTVASEDKAEESSSEEPSAEASVPQGESAAEQASAPAEPSEGNALDEAEQPAAVLSEAAEKEQAASNSERAATAKAKDAPDGQEETETTDENTASEEDNTAEGEETLTLSWNYETLTLPLQPGTYTVDATLPDGYVLAEDAAALQVTLDVAHDAEENTEEAPAEEAPSVTNDIAPLAADGNFDVMDPNTVSTVSPVGTTINLFNYWVTDNDVDPAEDDNQNTNDQTYDYDIQPKAGINKDHALKFTMGVNKADSNGNYDFIKVISKANVWTDGETPYSDIVLKQLQDGYPQLNINTMQKTLSWTTTEGPWGNPSETTHTPDLEDGVNYGESLKYLFDDSKQNGKESWQNVKGLLQVGGDGSENEGYYYYDATKNYAEFDEATNSFKVYNSAAVKGNGAGQEQGQFFPFNEYTTGIYSDNASLNHFFGLTMTTRFVQMEGGKTEQGDTVTYEFSGDDDVWVFIDDVLVGDLGGIHDKASLKIDFSNGYIYINGTYADTLRDAFQKAQKTVPDTYWSNGTFADGTYHTLKFFYLERGNGESNMSLKFNLVSIPQSDLIKVDQTGNFIAGAKFELYQSDKSYNQGKFIATGTTDSSGSFVFTNTDGTLLSLNDLKDKHGNYFLLREIETPEGYRSVGDIHLYFPEDEGYSEPILLSQNYWETGAYAMPMVTATLPKTPTVAAGAQNPGNVSPNTSDLSQGTYFAVVFAKDSESGEWYPVSGDPLSGWTVHSDSTSLQDIINVAKTADNRYIFSVDTNGDFKVTIDNIPGSILTYYHILLENQKDTSDAEYTIGYYYTQGSLDEATANNTVRLNSDETDENSDQYLDRDFSVRLYVPNIKNYVLVQKVDANGNPITSDMATFVLYKADQVTDQNGVITVKENQQPYDTATTSNLDNDIIKLDAAAVFPTNDDAALSPGTYYLHELSAPNGYAASDDWTKIVVDESGVYANAGTEGDDITVLRGAGNIVRSMIQFAVPDHIDQTLTDINVALQRSDDKSGGSWNWTDVSSVAALDLTYNTTTGNSILDYRVRNDAENKNLYFAVKEGWSKVKITQNYNNGVKTDYKTNVTDKNLTNLFSRSTIVQVKNRPTGLTISKTVASSIPSDKNINFTIQITALDDSFNNTSFKYVGGVVASGDGKNSAPSDSTVTFADNKATIQLMDNQTITIQNLPQGKYTVEEIGGIGYDLNNYEVTYAGNNSVTLSDTIDSARVDVTNTRKTGMLELSKTVTGDFGDKSKYFEFTLTLKDADGAPITDPSVIQATATGTFALNSDGTGGPTTDAPTVTLTFTGGVANVYLKHNGNITVSGLPVGITCHIAETGVGGYTTTNTGLDPNGDVTIASNKSEVTFTNKCELAVPTGLGGDTGVYQLMVSMAGLAVLISGAGWFVMRRRKNREEE